MKKQEMARTPRRLFYGWWIVAAAMVGLSAAPSQFAFASLGLFIAPLGDEFGWNRAQISLALTCFTVSLAVCLPVAGRLVDRFGSRRVLVPSVLVYGFCLAAIPVAVSSLWHLLLVFTLIGSLGAGANNLPYMRTIAAWFDRRRGLAIGLAMAGAGFSFAYVPPLVQTLIDAFGWRFAYLTLAAITVCVAAPLIGLVFRDTPAEMGLTVDDAERPSDGTPVAEASGFDVAESLRSPTFWMLWAVFCLLSFSLYGLLPHFVPLLTDQGMPATKAALAASVVGITVIVARVAIGYLIDRFFAPRLALLFFLGSAFGVGLLAVDASGGAALLAAILVGLSIGAEIDLLAYLTTRYFGLRNFGAVYGLMFAALLVGTSAGPVSFGVGYELTGSYASILLACAALNTAASVIVALLPRYPEFPDAASETSRTLIASAPTIGRSA
jgi:MFS family permease